MNHNDPQLLHEFMSMNEQQVFDKFIQIFKDQERILHGDRDFKSLFIPGTRKDRVLLIAHVDTVWLDSPLIEISYTQGLFHSANRIRALDENNHPQHYGIGIGADDRAGIAALWKLRALGHSLLLTGCEESGCLGSLALMANQNMADMLQQHQFAIQFDRRNRNDLVYYGVGTKKFKSFMTKQTGYIKATGSSSDISVLCRDICGVNISIGYKNEHYHNECLVMDWWDRTVSTIQNMLIKDSLPKFELEEEKETKKGSKSKNKG